MLDKLVDPLTHELKERRQPSNAQNLTSPRHALYIPHPSKASFSTLNRHYMLKFFLLAQAVLDKNDFLYKYQTFL